MNINFKKWFLKYALNQILY